MSLLKLDPLIFCIVSILMEIFLEFRCCGHSSCSPRQTAQVWSLYFTTLILNGVSDKRGTRFHSCH